MRNTDKRVQENLKLAGQNPSGTYWRKEPRLWAGRHNPQTFSTNRILKSTTRIPPIATRHPEASPKGRRSHLKCRGRRRGPRTRARQPLPKAGSTPEKPPFAPPRVRARPQLPGLLPVGSAAPFASLTLSAPPGSRSAAESRLGQRGESRKRGEEPPNSRFC